MRLSKLNRSTVSVVTPIGIRKALLTLAEPIKSDVGMRGQPGNMRIALYSLNHCGQGQITQYHRQYRGEINKALVGRRVSFCPGLWLCSVDCDKP